MSGLDAETRGLISKMIKDAYEKQDCSKTVNWLLEEDNEWKNQEDLVLGYVMGSLMNITQYFALQKETWEKAIRNSERRMKKRLGSEAATKMMEQTKTKKVRAIKVELTDEDLDYIRSELIPMIPRFRKKIRNENVGARI